LCQATTQKQHSEWMTQVPACQGNSLETALKNDTRTTTRILRTGTVGQKSVGAS